MVWLRSSDVLGPHFPVIYEEDSEEGLCLVAPLTTEALRRILEEMLFALPVRAGLFYLPNPSQRFCLDLRSPINWFRNAKLRRHLSDFSLVVRHELESDLLVAAQYHTDLHDSTWLTRGFIKQLHSLSLECAQRRDGLQLYCFQLVEKASGKVAAMTFGFSSGAFFEDYTMCTLIRDERSCGTMLSKLVGSVLQQCGVSLWYWGYEVSYMREFKSHYGGSQWSRKDFIDLFRSERSKTLKGFEQVELPIEFTYIRPST